MSLKTSLATIVIVTIFIFGLPTISPKTKAAENIYCSQNGVISIEAEDFSSNVGYSLIGHSEASGGYGMQAGDSSANLDYDINFDEGGRWYIWIRTLAPDHVSNGLYLDFDGQRLAAPADHIYSGVSDIYLYKSPSIWFWTPEWQAPGEGFHAGPITVDTETGLHQLSVVKRKTENPIIDKIVLTKVNEAPSELGAEITVCSDSPTPTPTVTPTITPTPTATPTATPDTLCHRADINMDNIVNLSDYSLLAKNFLSTSPSQVEADVNNDGIVNLSDYSILAGQFLQSCN